MERSRNQTRTKRSPRWLEGFSRVGYGRFRGHYEFQEGGDGGLGHPYRDGLVAQRRLRYQYRGREVTINGGGRGRHRAHVDGADLHLRHGGEGREVHACDGYLGAGRCRLWHREDGARSRVGALGRYRVEDAHGFCLYLVLLPNLGEAGHHERSVEHTGRVGGRAVTVTKLLDPASRFWYLSWTKSPAGNPEPVTVDRLATTRGLVGDKVMAAVGISIDPSAMRLEPPVVEVADGTCLDAYGHCSIPNGLSAFTGDRDGDDDVASGIGSSVNACRGLISYRD